MDQATIDAINKQLASIAATQETILERQDAIEGTLAEIQEAISNLSLPGGNYSIDRYEE